MHEIVVSSLSLQEGLEVVDASAAGTDLARVLDESGCRVLMLACDGAELPPEEELLLRARPRLAVLALDADGRQAALYEPTSASPTGIHKVSLPDVSTDHLIVAIRAAAARLETKT